MKVSWNWLKELLPQANDLNHTAAILTDIGLEVEGIYPYSSVEGNLEGLICGEVVSVAPHPDADRLQITQVNIGDAATLQIVCGAPNVAKGQKTVVAQVGTTIHPITGDPFTIRKAKIRGVSSEGMLCAEDEIGLGKGHAGILVLPETTPVGQPISALYPVYQDHIIEIGLTANHADAFSIYGTAIEAAAGLSVRDGLDWHVQFPSTASLPAGNCPVGVEVQHHTACPRYSGIVVRNLKVGPSPAWMQDKLLAMGMRPINNVVDTTNYVLLELGQPLHAFDLDKVAGNKIIVRNADEKYPFVGLDEKTYTLSSNELMICDAEKPMCIGGVFGGAESGVTESTTSIFLESAYFQGAGIRRTETRLGLKTDASQRFAKGTDPEMTVRALERAVFLLQEVAGGSIDGGLVDLYPEPVPPSTVVFRLSYLHTITGTAIPESVVEQCLVKLQIAITQKDGDSWTLAVPARKNEVVREIDIVEEVLRLYGYNNIPLPDGVRTPFTLSPRPDLERMRLDLGKHLSARGMYEVFSNSISKSGYVKKWMPDATEQVIPLMNSLNAELDSLRPSTLFSGLEILQYNSNRKQNDLKLYEFGKIFSRSGSSYAETFVLSILMTGNKEATNWNAKKGILDIFDLKEELQLIARQLRIPYEETPFAEQHPLLEAAIAVYSGQEVMGVFGKVKPAIADAFDLRQDVYFAEIFWIKWAGYQQSTVRYQPLSKYPEVKRDLALLLDQQVPYERIKRITMEQGGERLREVALFDVYHDKKLAGKKSYAISMVFRDEEKTLTDKEVETAVSHIMRALEKETGATIRQ